MHAQSIPELAASLRDGSLTSSTLVRRTLDRIRDDKLNAFITINEKAQAMAKQRDERLHGGSASELSGIPVAIKDVLTTSGLRTTAASRILEEYVPSYSATAVAKLEAAGMVVVGKTNCDEFAMGSSNENSFFGPVKNPCDTTRVSGGSSGGSAAAVAAGYVPVALGTDTGGSVRLPASFCGVMGLKPTYGRVSRYGLIAMASSLDQVGIFSHTAYDSALILQTIAGHDPHDATSSTRPVEEYAAHLEAPLSKITIGVPREYLSEAGAAGALMQSAREKLGGIKGVSFVDISLPHTPYALAAYYICMSSEASANLARYDGIRYGSQPDRAETLDEWYRAARGRNFGPEVRRRIMLGTFALSSGYFDAYYRQASKVRALISRDFEKAFSLVDVILSPTSPTPAFKLGEKVSDPLLMYLSDIYTVSANLAGIPAISFPAGLYENLPVGLQLMGPAWSESLLLRATHRFAPCFA